MKILLLGEYSNVHHSLAIGLRALGHDVTLASDGDWWKNYPRDIDLRRRSTGLADTLGFMGRLAKAFVGFRGYDIVQLINPEFLQLRAEHIRPLFRYLRRHNRRVVLGAFGMDHYYVKACLDFQTFRYSDFNFGGRERRSALNDQLKAEWLDGAKGRLNRLVAEESDAIVTGLYEYDAAYRACYQGKARVQFIPFPVVLPKEEHSKDLAHLQSNKSDLPLSPWRGGQGGEAGGGGCEPVPLRLFLGIQTSRSVYKGTDIMLRAARRVVAEHPGEVVLDEVQNLPFAEYVQRMLGSDAILDQLYSYTPAMNALEAMARGIINIGGGEPEFYDLMGEAELRPIINVEPTEESVYQALTDLVRRRAELIPRLRCETLEFMRRHHDHIHVARTYARLYEELLAEDA